MIARARYFQYNVDVLDFVTHALTYFGLNAYVVKVKATCEF